MRQYLIKLEMIVWGKDEKDAKWQCQSILGSGISPNAFLNLSEAKELPVADEHGIRWED